MWTIVLSGHNDKIEGTQNELRGQVNNSATSVLPEKLSAPVNNGFLWS